MKANVLEYLRANHEAFFSRLEEFVSIPSVSADPAHDLDCDRAAQFLVEHCQRIGLKHVERLKTAKHDVVYVEHCETPGKPTVLLYGHYDVQPTGDLAEWEHDPFTIHCKDDGYMYARGVQDNKGQSMLILNALEAWLKAEGALPVNIKCYFEGDEESGNAGVLAVSDYKDRLHCDAVVLSDTSWFAADKPTVTYGLRGATFFELTVRGPNRDLHSGIYGGYVRNPINTLCEVMGKMTDAKGRVLIPGFYDDVRELSEAELASFQEYDVDIDRVKTDLEVDALLPNRDGLSHRAMQSAGPSFDCVGIYGGHMEEGAKTIIPSTGTAKISFRVVPDQTPERINELFHAFLTEHMPAGVSWNLEFMYGSVATLTPHDHPYLGLAQEALEETFGLKAILGRDGGSIPITVAFQEELQVPLVMCGMGLPGDAIHSPKERFKKSQYFEGAECIARLLHKFSESE